ncbi:hatching enzyme 1.2-like [Pyxicephalus adspersus]|uniref:hatching enzyme 1.2-like n=1 Tax=Pyxicephalus adspersus TaxID=30357 RepID=UPI003B5B00B4
MERDDYSPPGTDPEDDESEDVFTRILRINRDSALKLYHGDIILDTTYSATKCTGCLWTKSEDGKVRVAYTISSEYSNDEKNIITKALETFNTLTCIQFVERSTENDYLKIYSGIGCWSFVGRISGPQEVSLMKGGCMASGVVQHEIQHSLGFFHEQSRSDRDKFVDVLWQNINKGDWGEFDLVDTNNMNLPYDYFSVMHYGRYSYSNTSGQPTLIPKPDQSVEIGQRYGLSSLDISKIKKLYDCKECSFLHTETNGSLDFSASMSMYPDATNCLWLVRVNRNKLQFTVACGGTYTKDNGTVTSPGFPEPYPNLSDCITTIWAPEGYQIVLNFTIFDLEFSTSCLYDYLNIIDGGRLDSPAVGQYCSNDPVPTITSTGNVLILQFRTDNWFNMAGYSADYHFVRSS